MGIFSTNNNAGRGRSGDHRAANFATEFLRVSDDVRREMIESLRRNTNRLLLIPRARSISEELRGRKAPFQAVFDFETGLARALHPGRKWHPGAQYFYASYFKERAAPFQTQTHNLSAAGRLSGPDLIPLLARMDFSEGRSFVLLFIEEILRGLVPALATALKQIELDHHRLKDALRPLHAADRSIAFGENAQRVRDDFLAFQKAAPELIALYMKRAEADPRERNNRPATMTATIKLTLAQVVVKTITRVMAMAITSHHNRQRPFRSTHRPKICSGIKTTVLTTSVT